MAMELENWICDMANGDKEGLRQFYEETARSVYSFIFSVLKDPHESEDVMQETFLAVWEHAGDYVPYGESRWRGYLPLQGGFAICVCGRKSGRKL